MQRSFDSSLSLSTFHSPWELKKILVTFQNKKKTIPVISKKRTTHWIEKYEVTNCSINKIKHSYNPTVPSFAD